MSWLVSAKQYIPAVIGEPFGGGYFAGYISHTADGNPTHALIVAPKATGATGSNYTPNINLAWALNQNAGNGTNYSTTTIGATTPTAAKDYDGPSNIALMTAIGISNFPAAEFCKNLTIGGYTDWYLPARFELDIAYFNLKPSTALNIITGTTGVNIYAVPQRNTNYTTTYPTQTTLTAWQATLGAEAFPADNHLSSTENGTSIAGRLEFGNGSQNNLNKSTGSRVRAFRRIAL